MATIIEAFEAAKAGKSVVDMHGRRAIIKDAYLVFADTEKTVGAWVGNLDGWNIEEPAQPEPEPEYIDKPVVINPYWGRRMVQTPEGSCNLSSIQDEANFAGYGYRWHDDIIGKDMEIVLTEPFMFGDDPSKVSAFSAEQGQIRWCDFVRFSK